MRWLLYGDLLERHVVESLDRALRRAGHQVGRLGSLARDHAFREDPARDDLVCARLEASGEWDAVFNFRTAELSPTVLGWLRARGTRTVGWFSDDPLLYEVCTRAVASWYDLTLHTGREDVLAWYEDQLGVKGYTFPFWSDDEAFPPGGDPDPAVELGFLGNLRGARRTGRYDLLASLPFRTLFHGTLEHPLGDHARLHGGILEAEDIPRAIERFQVGLNLAQRFDEEIKDRFAFEGLERFGEYWFPSRLVQYAAVGVASVTLTRGPAPLPSTIAVPDRATLIEVVRGLLEDPGLLDEHRRVARMVFEAMLTADSRVAMLTEVLEAPRAPIGERSRLWSRGRAIAPAPVPNAPVRSRVPADPPWLWARTLLVVAPGPAEQVLPGFMGAVPDGHEVIWLDASQTPGLFPKGTPARLRYAPVEPNPAAWTRFAERTRPDATLFVDGLVPPRGCAGIALWTRAGGTPAHLAVQRDRCSEIMAFAGVAAGWVRTLGGDPRVVAAAAGPEAQPPSARILPGDTPEILAARARAHRGARRDEISGVAAYTDHPRLELEVLRQALCGRAVIAPRGLRLGLTPERGVILTEDLPQATAAIGFLAHEPLQVDTIGRTAATEAAANHGWHTRWRASTTPRARPRVSVIGYHGARNAGDELILESLSASLDADLRVIGYRPEHIPTYHGLPASRLGSHQADAIIAESDALLIGGGGLLQDYLFRDAAGWARARSAPRGLPAFLAHALIARRAGRAVALWSIGVGPIQGAYGRTLTRLLAQASHLVTVREQASLDVLRECGFQGPVEVVADPTLLLPAPEPLAAGMIGGVTVSLRAFADTPTDLVPRLAAGLDLVMERLRLPLRFVGFQRDPSDDIVHRAVRGQMRHGDRTSILGSDDPYEIHAAVAHADLVIAMRLHASLLANAAGVPSVGLAYDPKVRAHHAATGRIQAALDLDVQPEQLAEAAVRALRDTDPEELRSIMADQRAQAARGVALLEALLAGPLEPAPVDTAAIERELRGLDELSAP